MVAVQELQFNEDGYIVTNNFNWLDAYSTAIQAYRRRRWARVTIRLQERVDCGMSGPA